MRCWLLAVAVGLTLVACHRPDLDLDVQLTVSDAMPTVATATWDVGTPGCGGAFVQWGRDTDMTRRARAWIDDQGHARAVLAGLKPQTLYHAQVVEVLNGEHLLSDRLTVETGSLPVQSVGVTEQVDEPGRTAGLYVATSLYSNRGAAVILDGDGDVVWSHQPELAWPQQFISRVRPSRVGEWINYNVSGGQEQGLTQVDSTRAIVRVSLDGSQQQVLLLPDTHHDFFELGDGTLALLRYDRREVEGQTWIGDEIVELAPDGSERRVWSTWDRFELDEDVAGPGASWTHANALFYDKDDDAYLVSLRNLDCIVKVDRASGEVVWVLGGEHSDFALPDGERSLFHHQHQFHLVDGGIVVFDNGLVEQVDSRVVEYALDKGSGRAEPVWEQHADPPMFNAALGDVYRLEGGNTLITWSQAGQIEEVTPAGDVVWRVRAQLGAGFGFSQPRLVLTDVVNAEMPIPDMGVLVGQGG